MVRPLLRLLPLVALVSCTRTIAVDSPVTVIGRADALHLRSGERVTVDRIVAQTADSVVIEADGRTRRIPISELEAVMERKHGLGLAVGAIVGGGIGFAVGVGAGIYEVAAECEDTGDEDDLGRALVCPAAYFAVPAAFGLLGGLIGAIPGGAIGGVVGQRWLYQRKPPLQIAPTSDGVRALLTIEF
jgi:hypothetical protein